MSLLGVVLPALVAVAFFTLMERKVLGLAQARKGPNKIGQFGLLQPFADAAKLFLKESATPVNSNLSLYYIAPSVALVLSLVLWGVLPSTVGGVDWELSMLVLLLIISLNLYPMFISGWASNSAYAFLGAMRGVAQSISYEVGMVVMLSCFLSSGAHLSLQGLASGPNVFLFYLLLILMWWLACVAETNRTPFDFAEGESELVSGFNTEYSAGGFTLIFLAEYSSILVLSGLTTCLWFSESPFSLVGGVGLTLVGFSWLWLRATLPRFRYDKLMLLAWAAILPISLSLFAWMVSLYLNMI